MPTANRPSKNPAIGPEQPQVIRLDEKIQNWIADSVRFVQKIWLPALVVLGAVIVIALVWGLITWVQDSKEVALNERFFVLVHSPEGKSGELAAIQSRLDLLVQDSRGSAAEKYILKEAVNFLRQKTISAPAENYDDLIAGIEPKKGEPSKDAPEIFKKIEEYGRLGQERFPDDVDMKAWAANILEWVKSEREFKAKSLEKRTFAPVLPGTSASAPAPGASAAAVPQDAQPPPATAPAPAPAAPAPSGTQPEPGK